MVKPLLKWPGGKRNLIPQLVKHVPSTFNQYVEPFLGGGAFLFHQQPKNAWVNDLNEGLINFYTTVKNTPHQLLDELKSGKYVNDKETFLHIRSQDREPSTLTQLTPVEQAARFLYLNRTCFNGLYRVNKKGKFNTPYGYYPNPTIADEENILTVHNFFNTNNIKITQGSYRNVFNNIVGEQNFVYLDPPYVPINVTSNFTSYTSEGFNMEAQTTLMEESLKLVDQNNYVLISNSDTPVTRELYKDFIIIPVQATRRIGADATTRGTVGEILALSPNLHKVLS